MLQVRIRNELIPLNLLVLALIITIILSPSNALRIALGLLFLLFFPGYTLMAALFPKRERIDAIERIALSFGMSIAIVPLVGLILNYSPWGIRLEPALYSISSFIFATSIIAWLRRRRLPRLERLGIEFQLRLPGWGGSVREKILSVVLVFTIIGSLGILGYVISSPKTGEKFTEFYVVDTAGELTKYPQELTVGTAGSVVLRIVNQEYQDIAYHIEVRLPGLTIKEVGPVHLQHEQKWEQEVDFIPLSVGENQKVEFLLFKEGESEPYRSLHLWLNVKQGE